MPRTRIKICGVTTVEQAREVSACGVDAIGLVFHEASPRSVDCETARAIVAVLPPFVTAVGLFVDAPEDRVRAVLDDCALDLLQFHGEESAEYCTGFRAPYIKALRMRPDVEVADTVARHPAARAVLLDSYRRGVAGGTGDTFDWRRIPELEKPWILAGGLNPDNVGEAVQLAQPAAVDVSGGVESAPGVKDAALVRRFVEAVRAADERLQKDAA